MRLSSKALAFWPIALTVFLADCTSKAVAVQELSPAHVPHPVLGDFLRLTLAYNRAAAMSLSLGPYSRPILAAVGFLALGGLIGWYRQTAPEATGRIVALALIWAGAAGNLWDRVRGPRGVVDFIDVGVAGWRFWIFNIGDVAITCGAVLLAWNLSRQNGAPDPA
jgi:signal peptidase II